jgi:hypothetical protein
MNTRAIATAVIPAQVGIGFALSWWVKGKRKLDPSLRWDDGSPSPCERHGAPTMVTGAPEAA